MFSAINIGLSGMQAFSKGLQVISNNVTNLNTPGFKADTVTFTDMFNQQVGEMGFSSSGAGQDARGGGVRVGASGIDFTSGTLQQTNGDLDLAIKGTGFLVLTDGTKTYYTRTGSFAVDGDGFITLQGTQLHLEALDSFGQLSPINIDTKRTLSPAATTKIAFSNNLSSSAATDTISNLKVFDSSGNEHTWQLTLTADAQNPGSWNAAITDEGGATVGTGVLTFIGNVIDPTTSTLTVSTTPAGAGALSVDLDFSAVTSFSAGTTSTMQIASSDGSGLGALTSVTVDESGQVKLTYSNGKSEQQGKVALADFGDPQKLVQESGGLYTAPSDATIRLRTSGEDGIGTLVSKQIEGSNVDLASQFGDLILIQRGFQASSQVVSVANDMIQQLFGIRGQG
jgi:flagellar hook protein FlgE